MGKVRVGAKFQSCYPLSHGTEREEKRPGNKAAILYHFKKINESHTHVTRTTEITTQTTRITKRKIFDNVFYPPLPLNEPFPSAIRG